MIKPGSRKVFPYQQKFRQETYLLINFLPWYQSGYKEAYMGLPNDNEWPCLTLIC